MTLKGVAMGQASIDLPDPLEQPSPAAAEGSKDADDLLSQLAGDEIDRMLLEAGVERSEGADDAQVGDLTVAAGEADGAGDGLHQIEMGRDPALQATEDVSQQLNELFAQLNRPGETLEAEIEAAQVVETVEDDHPGFEELVVTAEELEKVLAGVPEPEEAGKAGAEAEDAADTGADAGMEAAGSATAAEAQAVEAVEVDDPAGEDRGWLRRLKGVCLWPLVWVNAPVASCPPVLRDALGKAAIVTLVNAAAVLVYVLVFRR